MVNVSAGSVFVGRGNELGALLRAAETPGVRAVFVAGEAGIGKSRLVAEFIDRQAARALVPLGRCPEFGNAGVPFAPFLAVLRTLSREVGIDRLRSLLPPRPALARWLPELATEPDDGDPDRLRQFGEMLTLLESLERPILLILEDLHWADDSSRELLAFLIANLAEPRVLIVGTYRPSGSAPLRRLVAELRRTPAVLVVAPAPFTKHEVGRQLAALRGREPEPGVIARVFERSAGNPLFVAALSESPEDTPAELTDLLLAAQADLAADARAVLQLAAVAGSPVAHEVLAAATDLPAGRLRGALREAIDHQLLTPTDTGYEFRHVLIREAVYQDLLPIERKRLHAGLTRVLREQPLLVPPERIDAVLAGHARAAGDFGTAITSALRATMRAAHAGAHPERLHHLEAILEIWDRLADPDTLELDAAAAAYWGPRLTQLLVLEHLVDACCHTGTVARGIDAADHALALLDPAAEPVRAARLHRQRGQLRNQRGTGGRDDLYRALDLLPDDPPTLLRGEIYTELAATAAFAGDSTAAHAHALAALEVADRLHPADSPVDSAEAASVPDRRHTELVARAHAYLGLSEADSAAAVGHFARARAAARDAQTLLSVITWESAALVDAGAHHAAIEVIQQGLRTANATFRIAESGPILVVKWAQALVALGAWAQAEELIVDTLADQLPPLAAAALHLCRARIALGRGEFENAAAAAATAEELLGRSAWVGQYRLELAGVRLALADAPADAAQLLEAALRTEDAAKYPSEVWALLGQAAHIPDLPLDPAPFARPLPATTPLDLAYRSTCTARTPADWTAAVEAWHRVPQPHDRSRALLARARAELTAGDRPAAAESLRAAATLAAELDARPLTEAIHTTAARAGLTLDPAAPVARPAAPRTFGLTARELDVLRLIAQGSSNRGIAAELFISPNTAGVHVSRILTKLAAATRTEAAAIAHRHGLLDTDD
ncbi:AAA family ATPase [Nocardia sp. NPDC048505]|uniref:helix-turn-helix transcriptional regulator n=1 Tax=unclassified Nocardia TaxID=2637762 RepID=UPI0033DBCADE